MMRVVLMGIVGSVALMGCAATPPTATSLTTVGNGESRPGGNVTINLNLMKDGAPISPLHATLSVNNFTKSCATEAAGNYALQPGRNELALSVAQPTLLIVELELGRNGEGGRNFRGAVLTPKSDAHYLYEISAVDGRFGYRLFEESKRGKQELELVTTYSGCRS